MAGRSISLKICGLGYLSTPTISDKTVILWYKPNRNPLIYPEDSTTREESAVIFYSSQSPREMEKNSIFHLLVLRTMDGFKKRFFSRL
jgi:hypothetical protein